MTGRPTRPRLGLDHVGVTVRDIDRALVFYAGLLDLERVEVSDGHTGHVVGRPHAHMRISDLATGDGRVLELIQYAGAEPASSSQPPDSPGCVPIGLRVSDLDRAVETLASAGYPPLGPPLSVADRIAWAGARVAYFRDPDGALVELVQRPDTSELS